MNRAKLLALKKTCGKCFQELPITHFYQHSSNNGSNRDRLRSECKKCTNAYVRDYKRKRKTEGKCSEEK